MSHRFLSDSSFHSILIAIDKELADAAQKKGCLHCGGVLHQAAYPRSPFGMPAAFRSFYEARLSFCCSNCRKRTTPPSVRFFGRRWFPAPLIIFISALMLGINERRLIQIKKHFGIVVSESTWKRWRAWWRTVFVTTPFWLQAKGLLPPVSEIINGPFPRQLFSVFQGVLEEKIHLLLRFLSPLTGGILRAV